MKEEEVLARWEYLKLRDHLGEHHQPSGMVEAVQNLETGRLHFLWTRRSNSGIVGRGVVAGRSQGLEVPF